MNKLLKIFLFLLPAHFIAYSVRQTRLKVGALIWAQKEINNPSLQYVTFIYCVHVNLRHIHKANFPHEAVLRYYSKNSMYFVLL